MKRLRVPFVAGVLACSALFVAHWRPGWITEAIAVVDPRSGEDDADRLARLRELADEPTLSYAEQAFVRQALDDGVDL